MRDISLILSDIQAWNEFIYTVFGGDSIRTLEENTMQSNFVIFKAFVAIGQFATSGVRSRKHTPSFI